MTEGQFNAIRMAKAIEYIEMSIPALGGHNEKAEDAYKKQTILEKGIVAALTCSTEDAEKRVAEALEIVAKIGL